MQRFWRDRRPIPTRSDVHTCGHDSRRALLVLGLLATAGCGPSERSPVAAAVQLPSGAPVILISIDTLRSDRLPIYGYDKVATPAIDALRRDAILFERAFSHVGLTLPSHSSILSGLLPFDHGVRDNIGYRFAADLPLLPVLLKDQGYATGAFVSSWVLRSDTGLSRGFDVYDDDILFETGKQLGALQRSGTDTLERALEWLDRVHREPFFLFLHLYEPHAPYQPPEPWASLYAASYDGEVAAADAVVGQLVAALQRLGVWEDALVVLLSDHGEGLMDHGEMDHLMFAYREVIQVPLLLKLPRGQRAGTSVRALTQLTDVAATIYSLLGIEPDPRVAGVSLLAVDEEDGEERRVFSESVYPRIHFGWSELASIVEGDLHYIDGPDPELYDLRQDPAEKNNIIQARRPAARRLRAEIEKLDRTLPAPSDIDPETARKLEALGYISGGVNASEGPLADPKSRLHVLADLGRGSLLSRNGKHVEAAEVFRRVLEEEPGMRFAYQQLGSALQKTGDRRGALEALLEALRLSGGTAEIAVSVAGLYLELGDLEQARAHAELALPASPDAYTVLAKVALRQGDLEAAERHLRPALANRGKHIQPLITKAALLNRRGLPAEALAACEQAELEFGQRSDRNLLHAVFFQRGAAYGHLGRFAEAKEAYRRTIELAPRHLAAYAALAFVHALENEAPEAGAVLERMLTENPTPAAYAEAVKTLRAMQDPTMAQAVLAQGRRRWPESELLKRR